VYAIRNGVDMDYFRPIEPSQNENGCAFVGALDYHPNVDGAAWFCRQVWPALHSRHPTAKMYLVGRRPAPAVRQLVEIPGVELVGQVPDVRPHLGRAAVAVVPLRIARGIQNKVLEAMSMGKATVASPEALTGLDARAEEHLLVASTPGEWVVKVSRLLDDRALRGRLGTAARGYVEDKHCWETSMAPFAELLGLNHLEVESNSRQREHAGS
jgi:glycosyltransferase involved in cell wall biosynthesis